MINGQSEPIVDPQTGAVILTQHALKNSERQSRAVFEDVLDAIVAADDEARCMAANLIAWSSMTEVHNCI